MTSAAPPRGSTLCLCMIVKNEARVIRRCLASVRPILTHWIVVDTGSDDGTQAIVRDALAGLPGELVERPWVDFAHNRSEALALARPHADYALIIDADDELVLADGFVLPALDADSYTIDIHYGGSTYRRPQLVSNALPWRYRGVLHEFLECEGSASQGHLPIVMRIHHEGARSTDARTYARDAAILERALAHEEDPFLVARYTFYLAQSYRDCGEPAKAADAYLRRAEMGFWAEEVFVSLYQAGRMKEQSGADPDTVLDLFARASAAAPTRAEAAHAGARLCRVLRRFAQGFEMAAPALGLVAPPDGLFVETWVYAYALADEYAVNASWCGRYRECLDGCLRALESRAVPAGEQPRILANMRMALNNLPTPTPPAPIAEPASPMPEPTSTTTLPSVLHLGSGKDFRADCFNVDVDASWHPDAVVDLGAADLGGEGCAIETARFGRVVLRAGTFDRILANDVLEHVPDLVALMTTCLALLRVGGTFEIGVPHDLSFGAWQDPTHVRTFNERSWLYYTEWFWYLGWREARFVLDDMALVDSPIGRQLREAGRPAEEIARTPRAVDAMRVTLRKATLSEADHAALERWRDRRADRATAVPDNVGPPPLPEKWAQARERYCIHLVSPTDYPHAEALRDAAEGLSSAFAALGGSAPFSRDPADWGQRTPIVFGPHLLRHAPGVVLPPDAVLFNLEPLDAASPWTDEGYLALLRRHPVLDYSRRNTRALAAAGIGHARHLAIRAMPVTGTGAAPPGDIDVLFYGSMNPRRRQVLDALRASGLVVVELFGVYGEARDAAVARAKVVVNVHFYEAAVFEAARVCPLLAAGACVVSEGEADDPDVADIADGLVLCPLPAIVERCRALVTDADARGALSRRARAAIAASSQADALRALFSDAPEPIRP